MAPPLGLSLAVASLVFAAPASADASCPPNNSSKASERGAFARAMDAARTSWKATQGEPQAGDFIFVDLPRGEIEGVEVQDDNDWTPLDIVRPWWGEATLVVVGHPSGTTIVPAHDSPGWGHSLAVRPSPKYDGRIWFADITVQASGGNAVDIGHWGQQNEQPLKDVRFINSVFVDHPLESVRCTRPISANQASITFIGCTWDMPNSVEHAVYSRNPYGPGGMLNCKVLGVGGQVWQEVNRPEEGPYYPGGLTIIANSWFENYHQDPSRAGSALTFTGGRDIMVTGCVLLDIERPEGEHSYGGFVSWDGGTYYATNGKAILPGEKGGWGEYANGMLHVTSNIIVQKKPDRSIFKINSCEFAVVRDNGFYGDRPVEVLSHVSDQDVPTDAGVGGLIWENNNGVVPYSVALALGVPAELLIEPKLKVADVNLGQASTDITF